MTTLAACVSLFSIRFFTMTADASSGLIALNAALGRAVKFFAACTSAAE